MSDAPNAGMATYWTDVAGPHWVREQRIFDRMLADFCAESRRALDPRPGEHVLDVGCGTGTTTIELARAVGETGSVVGCDISPTMIDAARVRCAGYPQISLAIADVQTSDLTQADPFDAVYSRFGVMFFVDPVAAFTNIRHAVKPGGRMTFVCWQSEAQNEWVALPARILRSHATDLDPPDPAQPGPFAFGDPARIESVLAAARWIDVSITPFAAPTVLGGGDGIDAALSQALDSRVATLVREKIPADAYAAAAAEVRAALAEHVDDAGAVSFTGNVWIVSARRD